MPFNLMRHFVPNVCCLSRTCRLSIKITHTKLERTSIIFCPFSKIRTMCEYGKCLPDKRVLKRGKSLVDFPSHEFL